MGYFLPIIVLLIFQNISNSAAADGKVKVNSKHRLDSNEKINVQDSSGDWCRHGVETATSGECICSTHLGYFCTGTACGEGFGMSYFHSSCKTCYCDLSKEWVERKEASRMAKVTGAQQGGAVGGGGGGGSKRKPKRRPANKPDLSGYGEQ